MLSVTEEYLHLYFDFELAFTLEFVSILSC